MARAPVARSAPPARKSRKSAVKPFARVVVPTLGLPTSREAEEHAVGLARRYGIPVVALHIIEKEGGTGAEDAVLDLGSVLRRQASRALRRVAQLAKAHGVACEGVVLNGPPSETIARFARKDDLVVMTTHARKGWGRLLMGSVTESVVREARAHVLVVHGSRERPG